LTSTLGNDANFYLVWGSRLAATWQIQGLDWKAMTDERPLNDPPCGNRLPRPGPGSLGAGERHDAPMSRRDGLLVALRRFGPLAAIAAVIVLIVAMGWHREVTLENIVTTRDRLHHMLSQHAVVAVLIYIAAYIGMASLCLPGSPILTATGGLMFGWLIGGLASVVGATIGATILFLIARTALGEGFSERTAPWLAKLRKGFAEDALSYLLFLRLVPAFPFWFVNIAPAILGVPLKTYVIGTFFGIIPATFAFASAGAGLDSVVMAAKAEHAACVAKRGADACHFTIHASSLVTKELILALALLGLLALIPVAVRKWRGSHAATK
jgi:uncharacterized membrane protein YdjX (TVP38/TMEM64 family)